MEWQELDEIAHDEVKLGGDLDLFYPTWAYGITLGRTDSKLDIIKKVDNAMHEYYEKLKKEA